MNAKGRRRDFDEINAGIALASYFQESLHIGGRSTASAI